MGKPLDSPAFFRLIFPTSCVSKLFEPIILSRPLFLLESNSILSHHQPGFCPRRSTLDQTLFLSQSISYVFNQSKPCSRMILLTIDFSKAFDCLSFTNLFRLASILACLVGLNLSLVIGAIAWFYKIAPFGYTEVFGKDPFLVQSFLSFHQRFACFSTFFRQLLSFC